MLMNKVIKINKEDWSLKITKVKNGFIVEHHESTSDGYIKEQLVFEESDHDDFSELIAAEDMLYYIIEHFGLYGSKHDKKRLRVTIDVNKNE